MNARTTPLLRVVLLSLLTLFGMQPAACQRALAADKAPVEDQYYVLAFNDLTFTNAATGKPETYGETSIGLDGVTELRAVLDGPGDVCLMVSGGSEVILRVPAGKPITGRIFLAPTEEERKNPEAVGRIVKFVVPADAKPCTRHQYLTSLQKYYENLVFSGVPGTAWFRHQERTVARELKKLNGNTADPVDGERGERDWRTENDFERTFDLVSGGRALSENLQLDRTLPLSKEDQEEVAIDSLTGITVAEMDWKPLIKDAKPAVDSLAKLVPADQHGLFFPSFAALLQATDFADQQGSILLGMAEPRSESAMSRERYEKQLCLPMSAVARLLGPQVISSVAITGGDLYFRTGTDVAVLFAGQNLSALSTLVESRVLLTATTNSAAKPVSGEVAGVSYRGLRSADRSVCSYVATVGEAVVVTNSLAQLQRLADTAAGKTESLAKLDEYTFFRYRYQRGEAGEVGLLIISDATIRRWCGPKWRIASSRITRAAAVLNEFQAQQLDSLVKHESTKVQLTPDFPLATSMTVELNDRGVSSPVYGSLAFLTPIQELDLEKVTKQEATFYERWRDGYQQNWRQFFDPIAVQLKLQADRISMDLSVLPLIAGSDYREMIEISAGASLKPNAGDLHESALVQFVIALNRESELLKRNLNMVQGMAPQMRVNPLSWLGDSFAIYLDQNKFWEEAATSGDVEDFMEKNFHRLPIALNIEVSNALKLTAFLAGARAFIEQAGPGLTAWETKEHEGRSYVKISATDEGRQTVGGEDRDLALYYAPSAAALVISLNEETLKASLDRQIAAAKAKKEGQELPVPKHAWIGGNVGVQVDVKVNAILDALGRDSYQKQMQRLAWSNLTILNEWKRRYPDLSPMKVHEEFWQRKLVCPAHGEYAWNDKWQTMESTVYGHPGEPKAGPALSLVLAPYSFGNFGLTFEHNGLRARMEIDRITSAENKSADSKGASKAASPAKKKPVAQ